MGGGGGAWPTNLGGQHQDVKGGLWSGQKKGEEAPTRPWPAEGWCLPKKRRREGTAERKGEKGVKNCNAREGRAKKKKGKTAKQSVCTKPVVGRGRDNSSGREERRREGEGETEEVRTPGVGVPEKSWAGPWNEKAGAETKDSDGAEVSGKYG